jgi:hypothetical protein
MLNEPRRAGTKAGGKQPTGISSICTHFDKGGLLQAGEEDTFDVSRARTRRQHFERVLLQRDGDKVVVGGLMRAEAAQGKRGGPWWHAPVCVQKFPRGFL